MRSIISFVAMLVVSFSSGCTAYSSGSANVLGGQLFGSGPVASVVNNGANFILTEPRVGNAEFVGGTRKDPQPVKIGPGQEIKLPLPSPIEGHSQEVEIRLKAIASDGRIGYATKDFRIPSAPRMSSRGGGYRPVRFDAWLVTEKDVKWATQPEKEVKKPTSSKTVSPEMEVKSEWDDIEYR